MRKEGILLEEFKVGDLVQLKSGGPIMTVQDTGVLLDALSDALSGTGISCQWFAGTKLERGSFPKESILKIQEENNEKKSYMNSPSLR